MTGHTVEREFYVNDAGKQILTLGASVVARMREARGETAAFPEDGYPGQYVREIAARLLAEGAEPSDEPGAVRTIALKAAETLKAVQKKDLDDLNVRFDVWFLETPLHEGGAVEATLDDMAARGHIYEADGARWFRSTAFGDEKDRVVVRSNGEKTYFAADMAYHRNKFIERGFERVMNVWGADHHGYIPRMKAIVSALGKPAEALEIVLVQFVNLTGGRMGKRTGNMVTLREVIDEVGRDAARFFFLLRSYNTTLEFDLDLAKRESSENPVYYVQYGHARIASVIAKARELGFSPPPFDARFAELLRLPEEISIAKKLQEFPEIVRTAAALREPHRIPFYLMDVVGAFHAYYTKYKHDEKIVSEDREKTNARLFLLNVLRRVLANGLAVLGVGAPEKM
jgi:arginyl-tRNA synthetase